MTQATLNIGRLKEFEILKVWVWNFKLCFSFYKQLHFGSVSDCLGLFVTSAQLFNG